MFFGFFVGEYDLYIIIEFWFKYRYFNVFNVNNKILMYSSCECNIVMLKLVFILKLYIFGYI